MKIMLDNTGIHAVGRCLEGSCHGAVDVRGLVQLATHVVFADALCVRAFEPDDVRERTSRILGKNVQAKGPGFHHNCVRNALHNSSFFSMA